MYNFHLKAITTKKYLVYSDINSNRKRQIFSLKSTVFDIAGDWRNNSGAGCKFRSAWTGVLPILAALSREFVWLMKRVARPTLNPPRRHSPRALPDGVIARGNRVGLLKPVCKPECPPRRRGATTMGESGNYFKWSGSVNSGRFNGGDGRVRR